LSAALWEYIDLSPGHGEHGYDRSVMEQKIFTALVYQGWTDDEIVSFADAYRLPRHLQERARRKNASWTQRSIGKARAYALENPSAVPEREPALSDASRRAVPRVHAASDGRCVPASRGCLADSR